MSIKLNQIKKFNNKLHLIGIFYINHQIGGFFILAIFFQGIFFQGIFNLKYIFIFMCKRPIFFNRKVFYFSPETGGIYFFI
jgi:hypothetical protein